MKPLLRVLAIVAVLIGLGAPAHAAEFRSEERITVTNSTDKPRDLHLAGENITVDDSVTGDLVVADGTILINGDVEGSLFVAGGTVTIRSHVHRHIRVAGGNVTISGRVDGDLFVAGGTVNLDEAATVAGGAYIAGGDVSLAGSVTGELRLGAGSTRIDGSVGPSRVYGDSIILTNRARVNGDFTYFSSRNADIDSAAVISGQTVYKHYDSHRFDRYGFFFGAALTLGFLLRLLGAILLGWILIRFWPRTVERAIKFAWNSTLPSLGYGLATVFLAVFVGLILVMSVVGIGLAGLMFGLWLLILMLGSMLGKILLGAWLYRLFTKDASYQVNIRTVTLGVVVSSLLIFVPLIGPLVSAIIFFVGVGAVFNLIVHSRETATTDSTSS